MQVVAAVVPRRLEVGRQPGGWARQLVHPVVEVAGRVEPPEDVVLPEPARGPPGSPAGQEDVPAGPVKLLGDLAAGLAASDHQNPARRQLPRVPVVRHVDLEQVGRERGRARRAVGPLVRAGAQDHGGGDDVSGRGGESEVPVRLRPDGADLDALAHRRADRARVALEVAHELVAGHEAVGVRPVVRVAGELHAPIGSDEAEAVPAPAPGLSDPASLEHHVPHAGLRELAAYGEPGLTATDDDRPDPFGHRSGRSYGGRTAARRSRRTEDMMLLALAAVALLALVPASAAADGLPAVGIDARPLSAPGGDVAYVDEERQAQHAPDRAALATAASLRERRIAGDLLAAGGGLRRLAERPLRGRPHARPDQPAHALSAQAHHLRGRRSRSAERAPPDHLKGDFSFDAISPDGR